MLVKIICQHEKGLVWHEILQVTRSFIDSVKLTFKMYTVVWCINDKEESRGSLAIIGKLIIILENKLKALT